ncbi:hypothetical protein [Janthinobacterium sp. B9-8]|uniref:hypothetical protein n=1 Tax=Janthinobacterium sp. B9-8 TaxID=1236179 RepID=UPI00061D181B|nr:hypothetical protein [Janthinobacterium sp. B9-8]AMC34788.1 hypothetical protein VN23_09285 [Janthinobacterium sp. B9-8]
MLKNEEIKRIFLENGFSVKEGESDLKPYVYQAARALLAGVEAELAALQQDVARYRWLRDTPDDASDFLNIRGDDFDHAIDAAMQAEPLAQQPSGNSEQLPDWPEDRGEHPQRGLGANP